MTQTLIPLDVELIYDALRHLTVGRAVNFLTYTFDANDHEILDRSDTRRKWATTPGAYALDNHDKLASDADIVFFGGPPDAEEWYSGTLLAMLVDRLLFNQVIGNDHAVQRFVDAMANA